MHSPRRDFLKAAAGAATLPLVAGVARAQSPALTSWDSKLMGDGKFIDVDGIRTHYYEGGQGEAMVLIVSLPSPTPSMVTSP